MEKKTSPKRKRYEFTEWKLYSGEGQYAVNRQKTLSKVFDGHLFHLEKTTKRSKYWSCASKKREKCRARFIHAIGSVGITYCKQNIQHNHPPPQLDIKEITDQPEPLEEIEKPEGFEEIEEIEELDESEEVDESEEIEEIDESEEIEEIYESEEFEEIEVIEEVEVHDEESTATTRTDYVEELIEQEELVRPTATAAAEKNSSVDSRISFSFGEYSTEECDSPGQFSDCTLISETDDDEDDADEKCESVAYSKKCKSVGDNKKRQSVGEGTTAKQPNNNNNTYLASMFSDYAEQYEEGILTRIKKDSELIRQVKKRPLLYNKLTKKSERHPKPALRNKYWKKIARAMEWTVEKCRRRWGCLRDQFVKQYERIDDPMNPPKKKWTFYDEMLFLAPFIKKQQRLRKTL